MSIVATRRLIAASASLDPIERALLNLWVNRGLDDPALARMTGMSTEAIAARREKIVEHLSQELGLPPTQIQTALSDMAASSVQERDERVPAGAGTAAAAGAGGAAAIGPAGAAAPPSPGPEPKSSPDRKWGSWLLLGLAVVIVVAIVLILALGSGSSRHRSPPVTRAATTPVPATPTTPTTPTSPATPTTPTKPAGTASPRHRALVPLPGGNAKVYGFVNEVGKPGHLKLRLRVIGLPPARGGHYEVWLYNSVLDSRAMGALPAGAHQATFPLGQHAPQYHWIDVSFQPRGTIDHSGESVLRATNPDQTIAP